jgi:hypothetical protein
MLLTLRIPKNVRHATRLLISSHHQYNVFGQDAPSVLMNFCTSLWYVRLSSRRTCADLPVFPPIFLAPNEPFMWTNRELTKRKSIGNQMTLRDGLCAHELHSCALSSSFSRARRRIGLRCQDGVTFTVH